MIRGLWPSRPFRALIGLGAVVAGGIKLHRRVVIFEGTVALWMAVLSIAAVMSLIPPVAALALALAVLTPYVYVSALHPSGRSALPLPPRLASTVTPARGAICWSRSRMGRLEAAHRSAPSGRTDARSRAILGSLGVSLASRMADAAAHVGRVRGLREMEAEDAGTEDDDVNIDGLQVVVAVDVLLEGSVVDKVIVAEELDLFALFLRQNVLGCERVNSKGFRKNFHFGVGGGEDIEPEYGPWPISFWLL